MISDRAAQSMRIDGNDCVIAFEGGDAPPIGTPSLLLDDRGRLVGVDLGGGGLDRVAIMVGPHEAVASRRPARVTVSAGEVRVHGESALAPHRALK